ncbi:DegT/DnrJ/EryC1/StrS family aminotransferase [Paucibacter sp. TC2R-5]|uniref:DegT/DnrJ/EryC1/StrS family aminotransferase n=1 Tax=Paucibacter sp. TC2R-5 TaxID=2893555 RepID=UPI0021E4B67F|nr:DegT/DnrJ/EryC1/StrS family aminotransferase [Paucibacter sp. TC2R-5]MCV2361786.1 DegT/DnrJ/EryC1/StrS family aminotransferase [Paucibacter sp. TC2R-5]
MSLILNLYYVQRRTKINIPFIDLKRFEPGFHDALMSKLHSMTLGAQFIGGQEVAELEQRLLSKLEVAHAVTCANGTDALQLALRAVGVGAGDVVLVPNATFWATFEAVVNVGAKPVTVDSDLSDGGVCVDAFEQAIREGRPKAALIAHLYGWGSARILELRALCRQHGVVLIEDGAQAFGVRYQGHSIYKSAQISTTSFYPAKVLGGAGDGGAVFTDDATIADKVRRLGNHGRTAHYGYGDVGWNSRLDSLQAAFLNLSLDHIEARIASRREAVAFYRQHLPDTGIQLMNAPDGYEENGYCNVCLMPDLASKAALEASLKAAGIGFGNIYPSVMSKQPGAAAYLEGHFGGQVGEQLCASVLNLPLYPYMTETELHRIVNVVREGQEAIHGR